MDILSRLFDEMHLQRVQYISVQAHGEWQLEQTLEDYLTFIVIVSGELYLNYADQQQCITANNMIMLTSKGSYTCQPKPVLSNSMLKTAVPAHIEGQINLQIGDKDLASDTMSDAQDKANVSFIIVRSQFDADMARPLLSALPPSLPPPTQQYSAYNEVVSIGLQFFLLEVGLNRPGKTTMLERLASMLMIECIREYVEQLETAAVTSDKNSLEPATNNQPKTIVTPSQASWVDNPWQQVINTENDVLDKDEYKHNGHWLAALKDTHLSKTLYLMHRYPEEPWTLQRLAKQSGLSRSSLSERFRRVVGITPQAYLNHYRLRLAARFLRQEQYSIDKISELVGYASNHSFSGAFKRRYGQSPSHYRKSFSQQPK